MAAQTWGGGGADNNFSTAGNWVSGNVPVAGDTVTYNNTSVKNCTVDNIGTFNGSITVASGYTGVITQAENVSGIGAFSIAAGTWSMSTFTFSCGTNTFGISGGTFTAGSGTMTTGAVTFQGGTLTATSGTWNCSGNFTQSNAPTFTANGGTINFNNSGAASLAATGITFNLITLNATGNFNIQAGTTCPFGSNPSTSVGSAQLTIFGIATWSGALSHTGNFVTGNGSTLTGTSTPTLAVNLNLTITATTTVTNTIGTVTLNGVNSSTFTDTGGALANSVIVLNKTTSGGFIVAASTNAHLGANPTLTTGSGVITVNGRLTWTGNLNSVTTGLFSTANGSTLTGSSTPTLSVAGSLTIGVTTTITNAIGTVTMASSTTATYTDTGNALSGSTIVVTTVGNISVTIAASTTANLGNNPTVNCGTSTFTVTGAITWTGTLSDAGTTMFALNGTMTGGSTIDCSGGGNTPGNPTFGAASVTTGVTTIKIGGNLTVTAGATFPTGVSVQWSGQIPGTIDANGITFANCVISGTANFTIQNGTIFGLGASPSVNIGTGNTINVNGSTMSYSGSWTLVGNLTVNAAGIVSGAGTSITLSDGNLTLNAASSIPVSWNVTMNQTLAAARTFAGAGLSFGAFRRMGSGTGATVVTGSNTFASFQDNDGTSSHTLQFSSGGVTTIAGSASQWMVDGGGSGNIVTLASSTPGTAYTITFSGQTPINLRSCRIQDLTVGANPPVWAGPFCTNVSNNTNVNFEINPMLRPGAVAYVG